MNRRQTLIGAAAFMAAPAAAATEKSRITAFAFSFRTLDGSGEIRLSEHAGHPLLIVNTASLCGYTPQYSGLETLWTRYRDRGLVVIGVPSNDFGSQEPGGAEEIGHTAHAHGVTFPLAIKTPVTGDNRHPFYKWAAQEKPFDLPRWNFHKYVVGRDGRIAGVFPSKVEPLDPRLIAVIEGELAPAASGRS